MKLIQFSVLAFALLFAVHTKAGVLIEPVLGYSFKTFEADGPDTSEEKGSGVSFGGRLGYQNLGFQLGLDYLRSNISMDDNDFKEDLITSEWGAFVGFEFPVLLRVYAGYIFSANAETEFAGGEKVKLQDGTGMKFGLGFTGLPFVDINFEYRKGTYTKLKAGDSANVDTDFNAFMIGVSLPFVI